MLLISDNHWIEVTLTNSSVERKMAVLMFDSYSAKSALILLMHEFFLFSTISSIRALFLFIRRAASSFASTLVGLSTNVVFWLSLKRIENYFSCL